MEKSGEAGIFEFAGGWALMKSVELSQDRVTSWDKAMADEETRTWSEILVKTLTIHFTSAAATGHLTSLLNVITILSMLR